MLKMHFSFVNILGNIFLNFLYIISDMITIFAINQTIFIYIYKKNSGLISIYTDTFRCGHLSEHPEQILSARGHQHFCQIV